MCLTALKKNPPKKGIGYKVYEVFPKDDKLHTPYFNSIHKIGETYNDEETDVIAIINCYTRLPLYSTGYHLYKSKVRAKRHSKNMTLSDNASFVIVKVQYDNVTAWGKEFNNIVIVAKKIKLLKIV